MLIAASKIMLPLISTIFNMCSICICTVAKSTCCRFRFIFTFILICKLLGMRCCDNSEIDAAKCLMSELLYSMSLALRSVSSTNGKEGIFASSSSCSVFSSDAKSITATDFSVARGSTACSPKCAMRQHFCLCDCSSIYLKIRSIRPKCAEEKLFKRWNKPETLNRVVEPFLLCRKRQKTGNFRFCCTGCTARAHTRSIFPQTGSIFTQIGQNLLFSVLSHEIDT